MCVLLTIIGGVFEASKTGISPLQIARLMPYIVPRTLPFTLPACFLLACTLVFSALAGNNELLAAKAAGIHPVRLMQPAFLVGAVLAVLGVLIADRFIPHCNRMAAKIAMGDADQIVLAFLSQKGQLTDPKRTYQINVHSVTNGRLVRPILIRLDSDEAKRTIVEARDATIRLDTNEAGERGLRIKMSNCIVQTGTTTAKMHEYETPILPLPAIGEMASDSKIESTSFDGSRKLTRRLEAEANDKLISGSFESLNHGMAGQLESLATQISETGSKYRELATRARKSSADIHMRLNLALATISFAALSCPICMLSRRRDFLRAFFLSFLPILAIYYPSTIFIFNLFKESSGGLPVGILWLPTVAVAAAGIPFTRRVIQY